MRRSDEEMTIDEVLAYAHRKNGQGQYRHVGVEENTPLTELERSEEGEVADDWAVRREAFDRLLGFFFAEGANPAKVVRRVYAVAKAFHPELIANMSMRDLGKMFGESHGAWDWRVQAVIHEYVAEKTGQEIQLPWQKSTTAREKYRALQQGNGNRRGNTYKKKGEKWL